MSVPGINAAPHEFLFEGRRYATTPRLLVAILPANVLLADLFRNPCRWHPSDVPPRLRGTFRTPNHAGEVLLQTLKPSERGATKRRTASAPKSLYVAGSDARTLIAQGARIADLLTDPADATDRDASF